MKVMPITNHKVITCKIKRLLPKTKRFFQTSRIKVKFDRVQESNIKLHLYKRVIKLIMIITTILKSLAKIPLEGDLILAKCIDLLQPAYELVLEQVIMRCIVQAYQLVTVKEW